MRERTAHHGRRWSLSLLVPALDSTSLRLLVVVRRLPGRVALDRGAGRTVRPAA